MIGASSIVCFRSAVKEPLDTEFVLLSRVRGNKHTYLLIVRYEEKAGADVLRILGRIKKVLKNKTSANGKTEMTYEVKIKADNTAFVEEITAINGVESATIVEFTGDYSA